MASDMSLLLTACVAVNLLDVDLMCSNCALNPQLFRGEVLYLPLPLRKIIPLHALESVQTIILTSLMPISLSNSVTPIVRNRQEKVKTPKIFLENKKIIKR